MELELTKVDYHSVNPILFNCMKLLPADGNKQQQKLIVGDQEGTLQFLQAKRENNALTLETVFRVEINSKIHSIQLGGAAHTVPDKIFVALENKVCGFNKKGKLFLSFDTNLTENIKLMYVVGADLMVCGNHVFNHYRDCKDVGSYLCGDLIVDMVALCPNNTNRIITVLACSGRVLRLLEHARVRQTIELESVPTVLHVPKNSLGDRLICGFSDGKVVLFKIDHYTALVVQEIIVDDPKKTSAVTCLDSLDMVVDGKPEIILGRRDGTVQVYTMKSESDFEDIEPQQLYCHNFNESISSLQGGCFSASGSLEIIGCSYLGNIFGLTTLSSIANVIKPAGFRNASPNMLESSAGQSTTESPDFMKYHEVMPAHLTGSMLEVNDSMTLCKHDATYDLSIEIGMMLERVILESDVPIELMVADDSTENTSLVFETPNPLEGVHVLASFVFNKPNINRLDARIRTTEGQHGTVEAYIRPVLLQSSFVQTRKFFVKPLSLHIRGHSLDPNLPLNTLILKGGFSLAEIHNWIHMCLPEVPEKLPPQDCCEFFFHNVFIATSLKCEYKKGTATFNSDNVTTIAIIMDVLTKEITKKRIKLDIHTDMNQNSIPHLIRKLEPKLIAHMRLINDYDILKCLLDLDITEEESECLVDKYKALLQNKDQIQSDYKKDQVTINRIFGIVSDLYVDWFKLKGVDVKSKIPELITVLDNYVFEALMKLFKINVDELSVTI